MSRRIAFIDNEIQRCLDELSEKKSALLNAHFNPSYLGPPIKGVERYNKSFGYRWDETDIFVDGNEEIEERFHRMYGPLLTDDYECDMEHMLQKVIDEHHKNGVVPLRWFMCSTVRLRISASNPFTSGKLFIPGSINLEIIFIRPRLQGRGLLGNILFYLASHVREGSEIRIQECYEDTCRAIDSRYQGTNRDIFSKVISRKPGSEVDYVNYTLKDKVLFIKTVSKPSYQSADILNLNVPLTHGRKEWAIIAAISQRYGMRDILCMVERRFMSGWEFEPEIIERGYKDVMNSIDTVLQMKGFVEIEQYSERDPTQLVTRTVSEDVSSILMPNLRSLVDFGQDIYTRDYEMFQEYQGLLHELKGNVFLSFGEDMFRSLKFASFKKYREIVFVLKSLQRIIIKKQIMNLNSWSPISCSKGNPVDKQTRGKLEKLLENTSDTGEYNGFKALIRCDFESGKVSYDIDMEEQSRENGYIVKVLFIQFYFDPSLNTAIQMFLEKIPNVISILEKLCKPVA